eukprot:NODE_18365_length_896_cov_5.105332.p3 GENE.NODE_18365_length_896_cov_5.105332~~NODE_18365_length_896_cov_5.105332.p3  ORF type:complete len:103 (+),score=7.62 NODE_18365_length_896_cov_5.105332:231-539(+)
MFTIAWFCDVSGFSTIATARNQHVSACCEACAHTHDAFSVATRHHLNAPGLRCLLEGLCRQHFVVYVDGSRRRHDHSSHGAGCRDYSHCQCRAVHAYGFRHC